MTLKKVIQLCGSHPSTELRKSCPLQSRKNLQQTYKNTPIKTFGALWRKFQGNSGNFSSHSVELLDLHKTTQTERKNFTSFSRKSEKKSNFFNLIFSSYKNFSHGKFWYDPLDGEYCRYWKFERNRNSQFREKSKFALAPMEGDIGPYLDPLKWSRWYRVLYMVIGLDV